MDGRRQEPRRSTRRAIWRRLGRVAERWVRGVEWVALWTVLQRAQPLSILRGLLRVFQRVLLHELLRELLHMLLREMLREMAR